MACIVLVLTKKKQACNVAKNNATVDNKNTNKGYRRLHKKASSMFYDVFQTNTALVYENSGLISYILDLMRCILVNKTKVSLK